MYVAQKYNTVYNMNFHLRLFYMISLFLLFATIARIG